MKCLRTLIPAVIFLICVLPRQSDGSFLRNFRFLAQGTAKFQMIPSPSPAPAPNLNSGDAPSPVNRPEKETCDKVPNTCEIKDYNVTACVPFVGNGSEASYVLILNDGRSSLKLNVVVQPVNNMLKDIEVSGQQVKKVNLSSIIGGSSSILLNAGNGNCSILIGARIPRAFYTRYMTRTHGTYLLVVAAVFIGGSLACYKLVERRRHHLNGVPYQELEMGQQDSDPSLVIDTPEGWDQTWDDDWDEEKAVRAPGTNHTEKPSENGASLKYIDTAQWTNSWDDE